MTRPDIFQLLDAKAEKIHHTHIETFYLDESSYADIEAIDKDFFDLIELEESTGRYIITEIKKYSKPIEEIRNQIVKHTKPKDNNEVIINEKQQWIKYKGQIYYIWHPVQRLILKFLYEAYLDGTIILTTDEIFKKLADFITANEEPERKISHIFRGKAGNLAKDAMIVTVAKGKYRFNLT